jgi:TolA-binding protein
MRRAALLLGLTLLAAHPAGAQMDSREGIALQNQILQLRQEMEQLRRGGGGSSLPPPASSRSGSGGGSELVGSLLDRVNTLEAEVSRLRGRVDVLENQNRRLREDFEKYQGDMEFRLGQGTGGGGAAAPAPARPAAPPAAPPVTSTGAPPPRTPDRALSEGNAALSRRDHAAAEAAAREVLASRSGAHAVAAQMLLADALSGKRDFANAAIAYNAAYTRARTGPRAPEALIGLANSFQGLGNKREACDTLDDLRSQFPNLRPPLATQAAAARQRSQCR